MLTDEELYALARAAVQEHPAILEAMRIVDLCMPVLDRYRLLTNPPPLLTVRDGANAERVATSVG